MAGRALLQEQGSRLNPGIGVEPLHHGVVQQHIREGDEAHSLMVSQVGLNHRAAVAGLIGLAAALVRPAMGVVDGLVEAVAAFDAGAGQAAEVVGRGGRFHQGGERGRVGRHHQLIAQPAFESQPGNAERLVLIVAVAVDHVESRLRDSPGHALLFAVLHLAADRHAAGLVEQSLRVASA